MNNHKLQISRESILSPTRRNFTFAGLCSNVCTNIWNEGLYLQLRPKEPALHITSPLGPVEVKRHQKPLVNYGFEFS